MAEKQGWTERFSRAALRELAAEIARSYVLPIGAPIVIGAAGVLQELPWMYIGLGALGAFALSTHGLARMFEWQIQRTPQGKFVFQGLNLGLMAGKDKNSAPRGISIGFDASNSAPFPIEVEIASIKSLFANRVNPEPKLDKRIFTVAVGGTMWFRDAGIEFHDLSLANLRTTGKLDCLIRYGTPGNRKFVQRINLQIEFSFDENGVLKATSYTDAPE